MHNDRKGGIIMNIKSNHCTKLLLLVIMSIALLFSGCSAEKSTSGQRLNLSCETDADSYIHIPADSLNGNFDSGISCIGVKNLTIEIDGQSLSLESAIGSGLITVEEIWAYAMIDARNGFCTEDGNSENGLSYFVYRYPDVCDLYFSHDVYETPSGKTYKTMKFNIYPYMEADNIFYVPTEYDEFGNSFPVDREDWKLTFTIDNITSSGFDIQIYQPDITVRNGRSQHIGKLHLVSLRLVYLGTDIPEELQGIDMRSFTLPEEHSGIEQNIVNTFSINASEIEGFPVSLPSGSYQICMEIRDVFDSASVHPLMADYHQYQNYWIRFDIP